MLFSHTKPTIFTQYYIRSVNAQIIEACNACYFHTLNQKFSHNDQIIELNAQIIGAYNANHFYRQTNAGMSTWKPEVNIGQEVGTYMLLATMRRE